MPSRIGRYEIKTLIAAGGMGSLYLARDTNPNTNRLVALKLLLANLDSGDLRERFAREARALAALNHPNIVDIYDSGEFQGSPFIVMEYVRGETLAEKIKRRAPMAVTQKLKLMVELCSGLQHAHEAGIVHRDIKPANLMVDGYGRLKILDFGIARVSENLTRVGLQVTQLNMRIGTPGYMSPEQIEGGEIDRRSDIFAVGAVCYELLTYREAFTGSTTRQVENKVLQSEPEPLRSLVGDLDPEIERVVNCALAKDPNRRYQDATALEEAFERVRWRLGPPETPPPAAARSTPEPSATPRRAHDSRAEAVFQRCLAVYAEGAHDAARRFAIEALAEDPEHEGAREFMQRFGPSAWTPIPQRPLQPDAASGPTALRTESYPGTSSGPTAVRTESYPGTMTANAETVLSTAVHPSGASKRTGSRERFGKPLQIAAIVAAVAVVVASAVLLGLWLWRPGPTLTVTRPEGGTISGRGIHCGTGGSECTSEFTKGEGVDLRAEPDDGFVFGGFTGDCRPNGRMLMTAPRTCGATFTKIPDAPAAPTVSLTIVPPAGGTILGEGITCGTMGNECAAEHPQGKVVTLKALADPDFTFKGYTGECARTGETVMSKARRCGAMFVRDRATTASASQAPAVSAGGSGVPPSVIGGPPRPPAGPGAPPPTAATPNPYDKVDISKLPEKSPEKAVVVPPPPSPESIARDEIQKLLEAYRTAYEKRDVGAIKRVYPTAPAASLSWAFRDYKSLEYTFTTPPEFVDLDPALGTATVKVGALVKPEYKGPSQPPQKLVNVFSLKRHAGTWSIADLKTPPK